MTLNLNQRIIWLIALTEMINWLQTSVFFFLFLIKFRFLYSSCLFSLFFFSQNVFSKSQPRSSSFIWADAGATKSALTFQPNFIEKREVMCDYERPLWVVSWCQQAQLGPSRPRLFLPLFFWIILESGGVRWCQHDDGQEPELLNLWKLCPLSAGLYRDTASIHNKGTCLWTLLVS